MDDQAAGRGVEVGFVRRDPEIQINAGEIGVNIDAAARG